MTEAFGKQEFSCCISDSEGWWKLLNFQYQHLEPGSPVEAGFYLLWNMENSSVVQQRKRNRLRGKGLTVEPFEDQTWSKQIWDEPEFSHLQGLSCKENSVEYLQDQGGHEQFIRSNSLDQLLQHVSRKFGASHLKLEVGISSDQWQMLLRVRLEENTKRLYSHLYQEYPQKPYK